MVDIRYWHTAIWNIEAPPNDTAVVNLTSRWFLFDDGAGTIAIAVHFLLQLRKLGGRFAHSLLVAMGHEAPPFV